MTNRPPLDDEAEERRRLIAKFEATGNKAYLRAAACLNSGGGLFDRADFQRILEAPPDRGRPAEDDFDALVEMAVLMEQDGLTRHAAALRVASENPGHSEQSTKHRLDRKFRKSPDEYISIARYILNAQKRQRKLEAFTRAMEKRFDIAQKHQRALEAFTRAMKKRFDFVRQPLQRRQREQKHQLDAVARAIEKPRQELAAIAQMFQRDIDAVGRAIKEGFDKILFNKVQ